MLVGRQEGPILAAVETLLVGSGTLTTTPQRSASGSVPIRMSMSSNFHDLGSLDTCRLNASTAVRAARGSPGSGCCSRARLAAEGREEAVQVVQSALGDADDVLGGKADFAQQPRDGPAPGAVECAEGDFQRIGRLLAAASARSLVIRNFLTWLPCSL